MLMLENRYELIFDETGFLAGFSTRENRLIFMDRIPFWDPMKRALPKILTDMLIKEQDHE
jgi:hypothetical protein